MAGEKGLLTAVNATLSTLQTPTTGDPGPSPEHLAWALPVIIGIVFFMVLVALIMFYTVRSVEICVLRLCYKHCGCCNPEVKRREEYRHLEEDLDPDNFSMNELARNQWPN